MDDFLGKTPNMSDIIEAVYHYQNDHCLWPLELSDLVPKYVAAPPNPQKWCWNWTGYIAGAGPSLSAEGPTLKHVYEFPASRYSNENGQWVHTLDSKPRTVAIDQPVPDAIKMDEADELKLMIPELQRRVAKYPEDWSHKTELDRCQKRLAEFQK
jgi:hypothetical protein